MPDRIEVINRGRGDYGICKYGDTEFGMGDYGGIKVDVGDGVLVITNDKTGDDE